MKRFLPLSLCLALVAGVASADPATKIKQKAKDIANTPPPSSPGQPPPNRPAAPPAQQPPARVVVPVQAKAANPHELQISQIVTGLNSIKPKTTASNEQKDQLKKSLTAAAGAKKPSTDALGKLAANIAAAWPNQKISSSDVAHFAKDITTVLNAGSVPATEVQTALNSAQLVLKYSGLSKDQSQKIADDLKAIAAELQKR